MEQNIGNDNYYYYYYYYMIFAEIVSIKNKFDYLIMNIKENRVYSIRIELNTKMYIVFTFFLKHFLKQRSAIDIRTIKISNLFFFMDKFS